ncbi:hypothetical protein SRHO_G00309320 [Serrasalmus rhombeus]
MANAGFPTDKGHVTVNPEFSATWQRNQNRKTPGNLRANNNSYLTGRANAKAMWGPSECVFSPGGGTKHSLGGELAYNGVCVGGLSVCMCVRALRASGVWLTDDTTLRQRERELVLLPLMYSTLAPRYQRGFSTKIC